MPSRSNENKKQKKKKKTQPTTRLNKSLKGFVMLPAGIFMHRVWEREREREIE